MSLKSLQIPKIYWQKLNIMETERAIKTVKNLFESELAETLELSRVSAPLYVRAETGLNDDLNGVERPVEFDLSDVGCDVQIVQSLAKWKRIALKRYGFEPGKGIYADMNAIRRDEVLDNIHSVYVDQWDWEKIINLEDRNINTLKKTVEKIVKAICKTEDELCREFQVLNRFINPDVFFITSQDLEDLYPELSSKERENAICKIHGSVFIMQIGGKLKSGKPHDGRAPDYDDWDLNGDILIWYPVLERAIEVSSMGIRVDKSSLQKQLKISGHEERASLPFHKMLLENRLPLTIGGGIGQSRLCMMLLQKAHIGEVQASVWSDEMISECHANGIYLL